MRTAGRDGETKTAYSERCCVAQELAAEARFTSKAKQKSVQLIKPCIGIGHENGNRHDEESVIGKRKTTPTRYEERGVRGQERATPTTRARCRGDLPLWEPK